MTNIFTNAAKLGRVGYGAAIELRRARDNAKEAKKAEDAAKAKLKEILNGAKTGLWQNIPVVNVVTVDKKMFDEKAFKEAYPDLHAQYVKPAPYDRIEVK